jgi:predicted lipoprotein with Yx(FWY)xxD motif
VKRFITIPVVGVVALIASLAIAIEASGMTNAAAKSSSAVSVKKISGEGNVLVNSKGLPLYTNNQDRRGKLACKAGCTSVWKPFLARKAPHESVIPGKFALIKQGSEKQVTFKGKPLYTFALDKPGQVNGNNAHDQFGGVKFTWHVVHSGGSSSTGGSTSPGTTTTGGGYGY